MAVWLPPATWAGVVSIIAADGDMFSGMRFTRYFHFTRGRPDRQGIELEWIERTVKEPDAERVQADGRIRRWKAIPEADGRHLRVILLEDGETVHNAFFDRRFREEPS